MVHKEYVYKLACKFNSAPTYPPAWPYLPSDQNNDAVNAASILPLCGRNRRFFPNENYDTEQDKNMNYG